ncbi:butyrate kinase [Candidatus Atribacteria bacterium 4572_76]|nr:MAG: butyrate kinase [Candidatus Atribacteria bacterium 4572_76]
MKRKLKILVINPGSTSTAIALFEDDKLLDKETIRHSSEKLSKYIKIFDQHKFREEIILNFLKKKNININSLDAIVGRGGVLKPVKSGAYRINKLMLEDLKERPRVEHASNLGAVIAYDLAQKIGVPSFIVDSVAVDELEPVARISGMSDIERESLCHVLNLKAAARKVAQELGKSYQELNLIVVHLGGGISVSAHRKGRMIDVNNASAEGPFSPERTGGLPSVELVKLCYSQKYTLREMLKKLIGGGGLVDYLGTNNLLEVEERITKGDKKAKLLYQAMAYQIAKEIAAMAAVLKGKVNAIVITGNGARDKGVLGKTFVNWIKERVNFIAPVTVYPGTDEMKALALGAIRVLKGEEEALEYR